MTVEKQAPDDDRRKFLAACGRFAAVTPPAITLLLSTPLNSDAVAASSGASGSRGSGGDGTWHHRDGNGRRENNGHHRGPYKHWNGFFAD